MNKWIEFLFLVILIVVPIWVRPPSSAITPTSTPTSNIEYTLQDTTHSLCSTNSSHHLAEDVQEFRFLISDKGCRNKPFLKYPSKYQRLFDHNAAIKCKLNQDTSKWSCFSNSEQMNPMYEFNTAELKCSDKYVDSCRFITNVGWSTYAVNCFLAGFLVCLAGFSACVTTAQIMIPFLDQDTYLGRRQKIAFQEVLCAFSLVAEILIWFCGFMYWGIWFICIAGLMLTPLLIIGMIVFHGINRSDLYN